MNAPHPRPQTPPPSTDPKTLALDKTVKQSPSYSSLPNPNHHIPTHSEQAQKSVFSEAVPIKIGRVDVPGSMADEGQGGRTGEKPGIGGMGVGTGTYFEKLPVRSSDEHEQRHRPPSSQTLVQTQTPVQTEQTVATVQTQVQPGQTQQMQIQGNKIEHNESMRSRDSIDKEVETGLDGSWTGMEESGLAPPLPHFH